jgi:hypothetical protein
MITTEESQQKQLLKLESEICKLLWHDWRAQGAARRSGGLATKVWWAWPKARPPLRRPLAVELVKLKHHHHNVSSEIPSDVSLWLRRG